MPIHARVRVASSAAALAAALYEGATARCTAAIQLLLDDLQVLIEALRTSHLNSQLTASHQRAFHHLLRSIIGFYRIHVI